MVLDDADEHGFEACVSMVGATEVLQARLVSMTPPILEA